MNKPAIKLCAAIALTALAATTARAQWTYAGGGLNAAQTYDGSGVDSGLDPRTQGGTGDNDYIGVGGTGSITVQSGSLSITANDFKISRNANSTGTVSVVSGTLNINQLNQWGGGIGVNNNNNSASVGTANVAAGATLNWFLSGSNEQNFRVGNGGGGANGFNTHGTVNMNGGTFNLELDAAQAQTDAGRDVAIGLGNGTGILNLNSGTFNVIGDWPVAVGGGWGTMTTSPAFTSSGTGRINILDGSFVMSNVTAVIDATKASFTLGTDGYVNFVSGGTGYLSLTNWAQSDYEALVNAGQIRLDGITTTVTSFQYSNIGGMGIYKLADPTVSTPSISPTNAAYAGEIRVLSTTASGTAPFAYQWQRSDNGGGFADIAGANSQTYTQDTTGLLGSYDYQVIVTNGVSNINTSGVATLTVNAGQSPIITTDTTPATVSRYVGGTVVFSAAFDGNQPMTYQWQADTGSGYTNIPGASTTTLTITNLQYTQAGNYRLAATNSVSDNTSTPAALTVLDPAGLQFTWSAPVSITNLNADQILTNTLGGALGVVGAEVFGNPGTISVTLTGGRIITFKNDGSIATCTGAGSNGSGAFPAATSLTTSNANFDSVLNNFNYDGGPQTITLNNLQVGQKYSVQLFGLDNRAGNTGRLSSFQDGDDTAISVETSATVQMGDNAYIVGTFTASNTTETITHNLPTGNAGNMNALVLRAISFVPSNSPVVLTQPVSKTVFAGHPAQFSVVVDSYAAPTYQWQTNNVDVGDGGVFSGANTSTLNISDVTGMDGYQISCVVSNPVGAVTGGPASLSVLAVPPGSGAETTNILNLNPVAYWPLNETFDPYGDGSGNMPVYDAAGTHDGHYRPYAGDAYYAQYGPQAADGFPQFAADQGALQVLYSLDSWATTPALNLNTNTATISMWVNPDGIQYPFTGLLLNRNSGSSGGLHFRSNNELGYTWVTDDSTQWGHSTGLYVPTNMWSFVALVITPTNTTWYLYNTNGLQTSVYAITNPVMPWSGSETNIAIGKDPGNSLRVFNGRIDEVAVFNRSLNQNEVLSMATPYPVVITQPQSQSVVLGSPAQFSIGATNGTLTYQWKTNGVNVANGGVFSGANTATLSISSAGTGLNGIVFSVAVTNAVGGVVSSSASLNVVQPLGIPMYWDTNGAVAGSGGAYPSGAWSTSATNWTLDSTGASMTTVWTNGNSAVFSAGTDQTGTAKSFIVTASSGILVSNITQQQGLVRLSGAALTPVGTSMVITVTNNNANDYDLRIDQAIADSGSGTTVTKNGPGVLLLESASTFTGGFVLNSGSVGMEAAGIFNPFGGGTLTANGGNIEKSWGTGADVILTNEMIVNGNVNLAVVQGANKGNLVFSNTITGAGSLTVSNIALGGALTIQNASIKIAGDVSGFAGTFFQNTVSSGNGNALRFGAGSGPIVVNASNAKFVTAGSTSFNSPLALADANYGMFRMGELSGSGGHVRAAWNASGNTTFEIGALNTSTTFAGNIDNNINGAGGRANVTKVGTGTLILSGPCSYTGLTTVSNGVLQLDTAFLSTNNAVAIASPGVLGLGYSGVDKVQSLTIDGATMPDGTYGAAGSGAANIDNAHFAGTGVLQVAAVVTGPTVPEPIHYGFSGNTLSLSWTNANWRVEMQTNSLSKGLGTNWTTLVPANSGINSTNITVDPTKPTVFYRLVYP